MEINLTKLSNMSSISLDDDFTIAKDIYSASGILDLKNLHVSGTIKENSAGLIVLDLLVTGTMILSDTITLEELNHDFSCKIEEEYDPNEAYFMEYYKKEQNILDIITILWENIVLEVPMRLTKHENISLSGEGWSMGENKNNEDNIDPRLAKLASLLDKGKE